MKTSIVAAGALLVGGLTAAHSVAVERISAEASVAVSALPAACRAAAWPYVPAECGAQSPSRPVRVLRAEAER